MRLYKESTLVVAATIARELISIKRCRSDSVRPLNMIRADCKSMVVCGLPNGEDLLKAIEDTATKANARSGVFLVIGALDKAHLGFYTGQQGFKPLDIERKLEIASCIGNLADEDGRLVIHAHMTVSDDEGRVYGGHVLEGCKIRARAELMIFSLDGAKLQRRYDAASGLHVLQASHA